MDINKLHLLDFKIFRAIDDVELSQKFFKGHQQELAKKNLSGLDFARNTWINNPHVYIMALFSGDIVVGGSRLHLFHPEFLYPFEEAMEKHIPASLEALSRNYDKFQAEWCGLWLSSKYKGLGLADMMNRVAIAMSHSFGLEVLYGICPRHTMDLFRKAGFRFATYNDELLRFPYPTEKYLSYIIECEVREMEFTFKEELEVIKGYLDEPLKRVEISGLLGDCIVQLNGIPQVESKCLVKPNTKSARHKRSNLYKLSKRFHSSEGGISRAS